MDVTINNTKGSVTFPSTSISGGDVKVNGTKVGIWSWNCENKLYAKYEFNGKRYSAWTNQGKKTLMFMVGGQLEGKHRRFMEIMCH